MQFSYIWEVAIFALIACVTATPTDFPSFQEKWFNQTLDHFRFESSPQQWLHRYLYNDDHWTGKGALSNGCKGPILFYTGNEGPIDAFWASNGFMIEVLAPKWGALLIFAEERYYGKSLPFGDSSLSPRNAVYLSTEQVLADYALLITHLKTSLEGAENCPVVAFGGSYGGTLTTYFRLKYPHIVIGGLAASAPIGYYANSQWASHNIDQYTWIDIVNKDYEDAHSECLPRLTQVTKLIADTGSTYIGRTNLASIFHLCETLDTAQPLVDYFTDAIETIPQENYPYAIGTMPGWPVNATCKIILDADPNDPQKLLKQASLITDFYYGRNYTSCVSGKGQGGIPGGGPGPKEWGAWGYQSCTETLHQFSSRGIRTFQFNMTDVINTCRKYYRTEPNTIFPEINYGGYDIGDGKTTASNLIWSSGRLDPWHGGGFLTEDTSQSNTWIMLNKGAHHFDLRGPHPEDPEEVTAARALEEKIIKSWIDQYADSN